MKILVVVIMLTGLAHAADSARGGKLYTKCMSCHGKNGMGKKSQKAPMIAGQHDWYIVNQVQNIISGKRKNKNTAKMMPFVKNLSSQDIKDLAAYISGLPKKK